MTRSCCRLRALLCAALTCMLCAATSAAATSKAVAAERPQAKAGATTPQRPTTAVARAKPTAKPGATKTTTRVAATRKKARTATAPGEVVAADGIIETECYRPTRGRGRCEPQCLPYTRCRSGIASCRTGHENGPVTWFHCEQARGNTSLHPADGRVLVLGRNAHNMSTGHTLYVEKAEPRGDGRYDLVLSHTNYDRRCNLETNMSAEYDPISRTIDVRSGKWEKWGRDLKVAGFIRN